MKAREKMIVGIGSALESDLRFFKVRRLLRKLPDTMLAFLYQVVTGKPAPRDAAERSP